MKWDVVLIDLNTLNKTNFFVYMIFNELKYFYPYTYMEFN